MYNPLAHDVAPVFSAVRQNRSYRGVAAFFLTLLLCAVGAPRAAANESAETTPRSAVRAAAHLSVKAAFAANTAPRVNYIARFSPQVSPTSADTLTWEVKFDIKVKDVDASDFEVSGTTATLSVIKQSFKTYRVRIAGGDLASLNATVELGFSSSQDIKGKNNDVLLDNTEVVAGGLDERTWEVDHLPSVEISGVPQTAATPFVATFTFSEPVSDFTASDLSLTAATATGFAGSSDVYTATITCSGEGVFTVGVAAGVATDANGNSNTAAETRTGTCNPALHVSSIARHDPVSSPTRADTLTWEVTFSEAVRNVDAADFTLTGTTATLSVASGDAAYEIQAAAGDLAGLDATVTLGFASGQNIEALDGDPLADVASLGASEHTYLLDNTPPSVEISGVPQTASAPFVATFTFSEPVSDFTASDLSLTAATATGFAGSSDVYTATITCSGEGVFTVGVAAGVATDASSNSNTAAETRTGTCNPALHVSSIARHDPVSSPTRADTLTWEVTFSEAVRNVDAADFALTGTTATLSVASGASGDAAYEIQAVGGDLADLNATVTLGFASGQNIEALDGDPLADVASLGASELTYLLDNTPPTLTITGVPDPLNGSSVVTFTFSEAVEDFTLEDITLANLGASSLSGSGSVWTLSVACIADGSASVSVGANAASDRAGNGSVAASVSTTCNAPPLVSFIKRESPSFSPTNADTLTWVVKFNEKVRNVDASDFEVSGTTASHELLPPSGQKEYRIRVAGGDLADLNATVTLGFASGQDITDRQGAGLVDTTPVGTDERTWEVDHLPSVEISGVPQTAATPFVATFTFSEPVSDFTASDLSLTAATATGFAGSSDVYTATITCSGEGVFTVGVAAGVATDANGNSNTAAETRTGTCNPALHVSSIARHDPVSSPTRADTLTWEVTFSEAVRNVDAADFTLTGTTATLSVASGDAAYEIQAVGGDLADLNATVTLGFASGQNIEALDGDPLADVASLGASELTYLLDNTPPTLTITGVPDPLNGSSVVTFTFSEAVEDFTLEDITLANLGASSLSGSGSVWTLSVACIADGSASVSVGANAASDRAGNGSVAASVSTTCNAPPLVSFIKRESPSFSPTNADTLTWVVKFNEKVRNVDASDFEVSGTTASHELLPPSGQKEYRIRVAGGDLADLNATVTLGFASGQNITDVAGNALADPPDTGTYVVDNTAPGLSSIIRHVPSSSPTQADTLTWRVTFSESVEGVDAGDFTLTGTTATLSVASGAAGDAVYEIQAAGGDLADLNATVTLGFASGQNITDLAGHALVDTIPVGTDERTYVLRNVTDTTFPRVSSIERHVPVASPTNADSLTWRVTFSESVEGVDAGDFTLTATTATLSVASGAAGDAVYEIQAAGGDLAGLDATVTLGFASGQNITDVADNALADPPDTGTYVVDNTAPQVSSITRSDPGSSPTNADALTWQVTFDESVAGVDKSDFTLTGTTATLSVSGSGSVYDITASGGDLADLNATVTLGFASGQDITDVAGNALADPPDTGTYVVDNTVPGLSSITQSDPNSSPTKEDELTWQVTFDESVENVDAGDFTLTGTTATLSVSGSGSAYDITASGGDLADLNATVTLGFASGQDITDVAGNALSTPTDTKDYLVDNTAPRVSSIARSNPSSSPTNANTLTWCVTFDESVENVDTGDFTLTGTTATLSVSGSGSAYDVTASGGDLAGLEATVTLGFASDQNITDLVGHALADTMPVGTDERTYVLRNVTDTTSPLVSSIERHAPVSSPTHADTLRWQVTFDESVENVDAGDFTLTGTTATLSVASGEAGDAVYEIQAAGGDLADLNATVTLGFASGQDITDVADNPLMDPSDTGTYVVDNTAPGLSSITRSDPNSSPTKEDELTWQVTFDESVENVDATDFTLTGTTATLSVSGSGSVYDVTASGGDLADLNATVTLGFASGQDIEDLAGNALSTPTDTKDYVVDNTAPGLSSITQSDPNSSPTKEDELTWQVTFDESVENVDATDFTLTGTTATLSVSGSGSVYDVTASGGDLADLNATVTLGFASGQDIEDLAGNALSTPTDTKDYVVDNTAPGLSSITQSDPNSSPTKEDELTWQVTFDESVENVDATDFTLTGTTATLSVSGSGSVYDVTASGGDLADLNATVTLAFASGQDITDVAGNALSTPTDTKDYVVDNTAPGLSSIVRSDPSSSPTNANTLTWRVTFDESVENVDAGDFTLTGTTATLSITGSGSVYHVTASGGNLANLNATVTLAFASGQDIEDLAGNALSTPTATKDYVVDNTAPGLSSITRSNPGSSPTNANSLIWQVTFDESVTGVGAGDFTRTGSTATLSVSGSGSVYYVTASGGNLADLNATVTLGFASGQDIEDLAGNALSTPTDTKDYVVDNTAPGLSSITQSNPGSSPTNANSLIWKVTFDESVTGVGAGDFTRTGSTATLSVSGSGSVYYVTASGGNLANYNGRVTLGFSSSQDIEDLAGNALSTPTETSYYVVDNIAPGLSSIARSNPSSSPTNANTLIWKVTFDESVTGVGASDFTRTGSTATLSVSGSGSVYYVTASGGNLANYNGRVTLGFSSSQDIEDLAGNDLSTPTTTSYYVVDNEAPTLLSITRSGSSPTNAGALAWQVTFDESVENVGTNDFTLTFTPTTGSPARLSVSGSGSVYYVTASGGNLANYNGRVTLGFSSSQDIEDLAGNDLSTPTTTSYYVVDNEAPTLLSITRSGSSPTNAGALAWQVTFDESVENVGTNDFTLTFTPTTGSPARLSVSGSGSVYYVTASGGNLANYNGRVTLGFSSSQDIEDLAGNDLSTPTTTSYYVVDNEAPTLLSITRSGSSPTNAGALAWQVTFDESVENVGTNDFTLTFTPTTGSPARLSVSGSGSSYSVTTIGGTLANNTYNGEVTLSFAATPTIEDLAGNALDRPTDTSYYVVDNEAPTLLSITRSGSSPTNAGALAWQVTFDESVENVGTNDFTLTFTPTTGSPARLSVSGSGSSYSVTTIGGTLANNTYNGEVTLSFAATPTIEDLAGNALDRPTDTSYYVVDNEAPTLLSITRSGSSPTNAGALAWQVTFDESVENVGTNDFTLTFTPTTGSPARLSVSGSGSSYSVTTIGGTLANNTYNGEVTLSFAATPTIEDLAGNALDRPTDTSYYVVDNEAPTLLSITRSGSSPTNAGALAWQVTFDESVENVGTNDFTLTFTPTTGSPARLSVSGSGSSYSVTTIGGTLANNTYNGEVTLSFAATPTIEDLAGNALDRPTDTSKYVVDNEAPTLLSITRSGSSPTNAGALAWQVTFDESVENVGTNDFTLTFTPTTGSPARLSVSGSGSSYSVTTIGGTLANNTYNGEVTLSFAATPTIEDLAGNALDRPTDTSYYVVDNEAPTLLSITRSGSSPTNAGALAWQVTFDESVENVGTNDFTLTFTPTTGSPARLSVSGSGSSYSVTTIGGTLANNTYNGEVTLSFAATPTIEDLAGNALDRPTDTSKYVVDNIAPRVKSITRSSPSNRYTNATTLTWKVTFDESVEGVGASDFTRTRTGLSSGLSVTDGDDNDAATYSVTASGGTLGTFNGRVTLGFAATPIITDLAGNPLGNTMPTSNTNENYYDVDNTRPGATVSGMPKPVVSGSEVKLTFTFDERVTGFDSAADLSLQNASLVDDAEGQPGGDTGDCIGSYCMKYYVWFTTSASTGAEVRITLLENATTDAAGNGNSSRTAGSIVSGTSPPTPPPLDLSFASPDSTFSPSVTSIEREPLQDAPSRLSVLSWRVSFSEAVQKVDAQDFTFAGSPDSAQAAVYLLEEGVYRVALSGAGAGRTDGSVTLAFASDQDIENLSGAPLASVIPTAVNDPVHVLSASPLALSAARSGPSFEQEAYAFSLPENRSGPFVLGQVTARDPTGELPTYLLEGASEAPFALDAASGEVRYTGAGEDYEAGPGAYAFTAEAARAAGARARASVVVTVVDVNEAPQALGAPAALSLEAGGASAQEDISAYFLDPDADALSFASVSSAEQVASVRMTGSALAVTPLSVGQAIVTVTATDARGLDATLEVAVSVSASSSERARSLRTSLSALGRTMGSEAVEMVTTRFEDTKAGAHMRLGGEALSCRGGCDVAPVVRLASRLAGISAYGREQGASPWDASGLAAPMQQRGQRPGMSGETLLRGSAFRFSDSGSDLSRGWTFWGRGGAGRFKGRPLSGLSLSGRTWSGYAGADYRLGGRAVAGVALSRTAGDIEITSALNGESGVAVRMTSVMPYGRWSAGRGLSFWGLAGGGRGVSELTEASGDLFRTDLFMTTGVVGMTQSLGQRFSLEADAFRVRIRSEATQGLEEVTGRSHRIRLAPSWKMRWTRGASRLYSSLSAGARFDGGDAERGLGAEAGLALGYAHAPSGIALDAKTRMLLVHEEEGFREWGASLSFKIKPGGASGISLSMKPAWGNAASREQDLWGGQTALREWVARSLSRSARGGFSPERLDVEVGYGIVSARGKKVTPFGRWTRDALGGNRLDVGAKASLPAGRAAAAPRTLDVLFNRESGNLTLRAVWPLADR